MARIQDPSRQARERLDYLRGVMVAGEEAEVVLRCAERLLENLKERALEEMARQGPDLAEAAARYRAGLYVVGLLRSAADEGRRKAKDYEALRKRAVEEGM